jgi:hypothetical protein
MSITPTIKTNPPPKKTADEKNWKDLGQLRRRLENSLGEYGNEERRFLIVLIEVLSRVNLFDRDLEIIIDSVRNLTLKRRLRAIFCIAGDQL